MRHLFCVIRVGEPALRGCGKPTLIDSHAQNRPRRRVAARALMGQSRHVRSTHVADRTRHSISGTAPGHSPSSQVGIPQPLTKQRPAVGQHVRIEQLGGRHVVEPGKGHTVRRSPCLEIETLAMRTIQSVVTSSRLLMQRPPLREPPQLLSEHPTPGAPNYAARSRPCSLPSPSASTRPTPRR